jgi:hypothetical protein
VGSIEVSDDIFMSWHGIFLFRGFGGFSSLKPLASVLRNMNIDPFYVDHATA